MKIIAVLIFVILFFPQNIHSQRNQNNNPPEIRKSKPTLKRGEVREQIIPKPIIHNPRPTRIKKPPRNNVAIPKVKVDRNPAQRHKFPKKKKVTPIIEEYNPPVFEVIEGTEIVEGQGVGYCGGGILFRKYEYLIMEDPYPYFPLRFVSADITYLFTDEENDYYDLKLNVETKYGSYFEQFGIIVDFGGVNEKLFKFNEEEEFLEEGMYYLFKQKIAIKHEGYKNLRIGYFDSNNKLFYPENFIPKKTDILVYVEKGEERLIKKDISRIFIEE